MLRYVDDMGVVHKSRIGYAHKRAAAPVKEFARYLDGEDEVFADQMGGLFCLAFIYPFSAATYYVKSFKELTPVPTG